MVALATATMSACATAMSFRLSGDLLIGFDALLPDIEDGP